MKLPKNIIGRLLCWINFRRGGKHVFKNGRCSCGRKKPIRKPKSATPDLFKQ